MEESVGIGISTQGYVHINMFSINNDMETLVYKGGTLQI